jgi:hypothetical protein
VVISLACSHAQEAANNLMKHDETACGAHSCYIACCESRCATRGYEASKRFGFTLCENLCVTFSQDTEHQRNFSCLTTPKMLGKVLCQAQFPFTRGTLASLAHLHTSIEKK